MAEQYKKDGLVVLAINAWDEDKEILEQYIEQNKFQQRVLLHGSQVSNRYGIPDQRVPTVLWIDRQGTVVDAELGSGTVRRLEKATERLINGKG